MWKDKSVDNFNIQIWLKLKMWKGYKASEYEWKN